MGNLDGHLIDLERRASTRVFQLLFLFALSPKQSEHYHCPRKAAVPSGGAMSGLTSPSTSNLLSNAGNDTIAPDVDDTDLEAGRGGNASKKQSTASGNQLGAPSNGAQGGSAAHGQMNAPQREQSIWEQSACVIDIEDNTTWIARRKLIVDHHMHVQPSRRAVLPSLLPFLGYSRLPAVRFLQ